MSNVYTCIAYLIEIRKFCSKNLVFKSVNFEGQNALKLTYEHLYTHPFNGPFSGTTQVSRYQKGKTNLDFTEARDSEWQ